jgi:hypothetical protein
MDEPWESSITEYGVVNVTGFRIVDPNRRYVRDFLKKWAMLDSANFPGAGRTSISVSFTSLHFSHAPGPMPKEKVISSF